VTVHLTDADLRRFATGALSPDDLLHADDHLSRCDQCRMRAVELSDATRYIDDFRAQMNAPTTHLSDEQLQLYVQGRLSPGAKDAVHRHVKECPICASQVEDLRSWAAPAIRARTNIRWLAIAAAVIGALIPTVLWQSRVGRQMTSTSLSGLEGLAPPEQARIRAALNGGTASLPDFMADLNSSREVLMGSPAKRGDTFDLIAPVGTGTVTDRPQFEWQTLAGANAYAVTVFDERSNVVARSPITAQTNWTPTDSLPRGSTYVWQVTAHRGSETITAPVVPAPAARFHVIDERSADALQRIEAEHPAAHLLLGILNMDAGIRDAAIRHLQQVPASDARADVAQRSLKRLQALNPPGSVKE
jgi:anti-sigma factor RsiW